MRSAPTRSSRSGASSGPRAARGFGIYATDIPPVGEQTIDEVIVNCFRGDATPPEVSHALERQTSLRFASSGPTSSSSSSSTGGVIEEPVEKLAAKVGILTSLLASRLERIGPSEARALTAPLAELTRH
jgi:hypothetical protein